MTQSAAEKAVAKAGLKSTVVQTPSTTYKKGQVITSNPPFGTKVAPSSVVTLNVSAGPKKIAMPKVTGESEATAQNKLQNFHVVTKTARELHPAGGHRGAAVPDPGTLLLPDSTVTIYVSGGGTQVQNAVGDPQTTAVSILQNQGFKVHVITTAGPVQRHPGQRVPAEPGQRDPARRVRR